MKYLLVLALLFNPCLLMAQGFVQKTNEVNLNFKENAKPTSENTPVIKWLYPSVEFTMSQKNELQVEALVTSVLPLAEVRVRVLDTDNTEVVNSLVNPKEMINGIVKKKIFLLNGQNTIEVVAKNEKGAVISSSRMVSVGLDAIADAVAVDRKDYALLFATDKYENWDDLINPINDAQTIKKELDAKYGFETELVENPDHEDVFAKLVDYTQKKYKPQDQLFIFIAGHGFFDEILNEGYVVGRNSLKNDKGKTSYVSYERLRSLINNIPCEHIFLVMDVCYGGTFDPIVARSRSIENTVSERQFLARKLTYKTRRFLTSGGKEYVPDGRPGYHSPFASKFIQALKENGGTDRILTLDEIKTYVERLTPEPRYGGFGDNNPASDFVFVVKVK
ncbi:MAG: caspase family protein [Cyclobacteriaceae bacterium]|jgi:hypothetical protein|nr:caspase family protein [Cyclobacteriaceae bacterium]